MISAIQNCSKLQIHRFQKKFPSNSRIHNFIVNTYSLWSRCWQTYHFKFRDFQFTENSWPKKRDLGRGSVVYTVWLHGVLFHKRYSEGNILFGKSNTYKQSSFRLTRQQDQAVSYFCNILYFEILCRSETWKTGGIYLCSCKIF